MDYPPTEARAVAAVATRSRAAASGALAAVAWGARLVVAFYLFVGALQIMKTGAAGLDVLRNGSLLVTNAGSTLGLGWIGAMMVLSGSPIAATSLTLVAAGAITETQGFTMLNGSRLGAAFVVLLVAVLYALRGGEGQRRRPVSVGVMALTTTAFAYVPGGILGLALLHWQPFNELELQFPDEFSDLLDVVYGGLVAQLKPLPALLVFPAGLAVLLLSFRLLDTVVPTMSDDVIEHSRLAWLRKKWPMFGLGCLVALITMSVSVALTVLVPLVARSRVKREDLIPYIMGANITTLGDTLMAAFFLDSAPAVRVVLADILGVSTVTLIVLTFFYGPLSSAVWKFQDQVVRSRARLAGFTAALFFVPLAIIAISAALG